MDPQISIFRASVKEIENDLFDIILKKENRVVFDFIGNLRYALTMWNKNFKALIYSNYKSDFLAFAQK